VSSQLPLSLSAAELHAICAAALTHAMHDSIASCSAVDGKTGLERSGSQAGHSPSQKRMDDRSNVSESESDGKSDGESDGESESCESIQDCADELGGEPNYDGAYSAHAGGPEIASREEPRARSHPQAHTPTQMSPVVCEHHFQSALQELMHK
jgi:hypothetical protein